MYKKSKKVIMLLLACVLMLSCSSTAFAQWGEKTCPGDTCYGDCGATSCKIYKVVDISTYYTLADCKTIVNSYSKYSTLSEYASYAAGVKNVPVGILLGKFSSNMSSAKAFFQKAVNLKCGITVSYEWVITDITSSSYGRNGSIVYE